MKIIKIFILSVILLLITACGNKMPFKAQEALEDASLVYVYLPIGVSADEDIDESDYTIRINNKPVMQRVEQGNYMVFYLKPLVTTISATKNEIQEQIIKLDLKKGQIYYLKINGNLENSTFEFAEVDSSVGLKELSKTGLAGSSVESSQNIITEFVNPKETQSVETKTESSSKIDEIQKAHEMKEKGIISDEEFQTLKTNILSK